MKQTSEILSEFENQLRRKGSSDNTILSYLSAVRQYFSMYDELSTQNLRAYRDYLLNTYSPNTVNSRIQGINCYLKNSAKLPPNFVMERLDSYRLPSVREQQKSFLDNTISNNDYKRFKNSLKRHGQMYWYFVIRFLAATGARISELIQIKMEHLNLGYMDLYSKGGKIRRIYFPDTLCLEASQWFHSQGVSAGFLFVNSKGVPMSPRGISCRLKKLARQHRIPPETVYPHSFRHRFAKNFLQRFNDISLLADLMGHESIETTRIYLTRSAREQKELIDKIVIW
ncbi:tyrosine-type recombinase/integrase [Lachnospiraceae bacterium 62-35]